MPRITGCLGAGLALGVLTNLAQGWLAAAFAAGPRFGVAGAWCRCGERRRRIAGVGALAGAVGAEAAWPVTARLALAHFASD